MKQPNVLFIITDQQRADHAGFMGNRVVRTPNLDAIAAKGMVFENAWVSNPVCMPNRSTIMTGRMPTAHGVIFNERSLPWNVNTFVRQFRAAGYRTGLIGKSHLQHGMSRNSLVRYRGEPVETSPFPQGWDEVENYERYLDEPVPQPDDFYGFDHVELAIDHGARITGHHLRWALARGARVEDVVVPYDRTSPGHDRSDRWWQVYRPVYDTELHSTNFVTEQTIAFMQQAAAAGKPWLAWCSFPDPHHPLTPPGDWFTRHDPADMALPESRHDSLADAPSHLHIYRGVDPTQQRDWVAPCGYGDDDLLRQVIAATYGMVEFIDEGVGRVLAALEALGARDDTIVVFTSDHGDMMGEHGLLLKGFMHFRGTLQVPFVIDAPGRAPGRTASLASSIDFAPTLLELCGIAPYDGIQGASLAPVLADPGTTVREHVLVEDDCPTITAKLTPIPAKTRTLITAEGKYTRNSKGEEQLFDLGADPAEMSDLKSRNPALRRRMVEHLADALMAADDAARGAPFNRDWKRG